MSDTHLSAEAAFGVAQEALRAIWPGWSVELQPLKPLSKPLRATVFRISGGPTPAVIKVWGRGNAPRAAAQAARQTALAEAMDQGPNRAPGVLHYDGDRSALIMQDTGGRALADILSAEPARVDEITRRAGNWLRAFHRLTLRPAGFRPAGHKAWLERLIAEVESGARVIPSPEGFIREARAIAAPAMALRKRPATRAVTHRDMTLSNLMLDADGTLWGIDFENEREDEPMRDLFSLALDLRCFAASGVDGGRGPAALTRAYGPTATAPDVRAFLRRAFALGVWANTPEVPSRRQAARLEAAHWLREQPQSLMEDPFP